MAIVVDTSVLIDHLRGDQNARDALSEAMQAGERLAASVLTKVELLAGMRKGEERVTRRLLDSLDLIEVDDAVAERAGMLATIICGLILASTLSTTSSRQRRNT